MPVFVDVILPLPLRNTFTYALPAGMEACGLSVGCRVKVPLGTSKSYVGLVAAVHQNTPEGDFEIKTVTQVLDRQPVALRTQMAFWQWISDYYLCSMGEVFKAAMPGGFNGSYRPRTETHVRVSPSLNTDEALSAVLDGFKRALKQQELFTRIIDLTGRLETPRELSKERLLELTGASDAVLSALEKRGVVELYPFEVGRLDERTCPDVVPPKALNERQQQAYNDINNAFKHKDVCLLYGVTSSGKTEIYIHLIAQAIAQGRQVLYLLPEIALTTQITTRLKRVFGNDIGIYHSKLSDAQRVEIWNKQLGDNPYKVILGARSAVFLPFKQLGLVIVDEEHESSYKQQDPAPRYHARNAALVLAAHSGAKTLLGTATPSVESWFNATEGGKYALVTLLQRYSDLQLPHIEPVNIAELQRKKLMKGHFSPYLVERMNEVLNEGGQLILFQNRRGYAPVIECHDCGWMPRCHACDVSLTYHKKADRLVCHYCGNTFAVPQKCPECGGEHLRPLGFGTEKIEDEVRALFPLARVARMDLDTTRSRDAYDQMINDFEQRKTDVLIGTQMVSKGLDFDNVRLVGILNADAMFGYPDFRAYERAYQLMAQVSGRAGRHGSRGLVVLQTKSIDHPIIEQVQTNDYEGMAAQQLAERQLFRFPPFHRLIYIYLKHRYERTVDYGAYEMARGLKSVLGARVSDPMKPLVARVQSLHIRMIMLRVEWGAPMNGVRAHLLQAQQELLADSRYRSVTVFYDVDPM